MVKYLSFLKPIDSILDYERSKLKKVNNIKGIHLIKAHLRSIFCDVWTETHDRAQSTMSSVECLIHSVSGATPCMLLIEAQITDDLDGSFSHSTSAISGSGGFSAVSDSGHALPLERTAWRGRHAPTCTPSGN